MTIGSHQSHFNHENWIRQLHSYQVTSRQFLNELFKGLRVLLQRGLLIIWNDICLMFRQLTLQDFIITALIIC